VQELSVKTSSKDQKEQKWAKATWPWRAEILPGQIFRQAKQWRAEWRAVPESSRLLRHRDGHGQIFRQAKQWRAERRRLPES